MYFPARSTVSKLSRTGAFRSNAPKRPVNPLEGTGPVFDVVWPGVGLPPVPGSGDAGSPAPLLPAAVAAAESFDAAFDFGAPAFACAPVCAAQTSGNVINATSTANPLVIVLYLNCFFIDPSLPYSKSPERTKPQGQPISAIRGPDRRSDSVRLSQASGLLSVRCFRRTTITNRNSLELPHLVARHAPCLEGSAKSGDAKEDLGFPPASFPIWQECDLLGKTCNHPPPSRVNHL